MSYGYDYTTMTTRLEKIIMENAKDIIASGDSLYKAYLKARSSSAWKAETMKCDLNFLSVLSQKQKELREQTYETGKTRAFIASERGKERLITSTRIEDRIVRHSICDNILVPQLTPKLIYDNGASIKGKGVSFTRARFERHLHQLYHMDNSNSGWILFVDFSKYYDNIRHDTLINDVGNVIKDEYVMWLYSHIVKNSRVDVSDLNQDEIAELDTGVYDSISFFKEHHKKSGLKYLDKSLNIGDQTSQISGVFYPTPIDNYVKIVRGHKLYDRYMDDMAIVDKSKERLIETLNGIIEIAGKRGIHINRKKTCIIKASSTFTFLQIRYRLTDTGHVYRRMKNTKVTRECDHIKALCRVGLTSTEIKSELTSWINSRIKYLGKRQLRKLNNVYNDLFPEVNNHGICNT